MRHCALTFVAIGLLFAPTASAIQSAHGDDVEVIAVPEVPDKTPTPDLKKAAASIVTRTNEFRAKEGHAAFKVNVKLRETAQSFAEYMARTDRYGHSADGRQPAERAKAQGYDYCIVLENIAYAFNSEGFTGDPLAEKFFSEWKASPGHRRNMLDPDVSETGVAIARSEKTGYYYAVQMFGRPKSEAITFSIANRAGEAFTYSVGEKSFTLPVEFTRSHEVCRPPEVTLHWPTGKTESVKPTKGQRLVVTKSATGWTVKKE